jgi:hypothetical protein
MRNTKPTLLLIEDLIEPIENTINELELIYKDDLKNKSDYVLKGTFVYIISLFESSLTECLKRFLISFPDKISDGKISGKESKYLLETVFASDVIEFIIDDFIYECTYKDVSEIMNRTFKLLDINSRKIIYSNDDLIEKKQRRNILVHNDLKVDKKYIRNTKSDPQKLRTKLDIDEKYIIDTITLTKSILEQTKSKLILKYGDYTRSKLLRNVWNYVFNSPLLNYDDYWNENHGFIFENNKKFDIINLSSGEKTWLAYWIQHYSTSILDRYFKFTDMNMSSYRSKKMNLLIEFFNKYPLILQHS